MSIVTTSNHTQALVPPPSIIDHLFSRAGITVNGNQPFDIQVNNPRAYSEILQKWSLGLGESYMAGYWESKAIDDLVYKLLVSNLEEEIGGLAKINVLWHSMKARIFNLQSPDRAFQVGEQHYDIGNTLFEHMLDPLMIYSCGYWQYAENLEQAQIDKLDMVCQKLELQPGETLLEIGCGWGGLAYYAAKNFGVNVVGITVSKEQQKIAQERCQGLPVTIELIDYRELRGKFDKVVSVGMFEHVGQKNYIQFFKIVNQLMRDDGLFLLHTIGNAKSTLGTDPWINRYIFPNGKIPSAVEMTKSMEGLFLIEDWHNFGLDYDKTLMAWYKNFKANWYQIKDKYDDRFYRMWTYYLLSCAGYFRSKQGQLWQLMLTKQKRDKPYRSIRITR